MDQSFLENIKSQKEDQRELLIGQLGIFELRGLAREVGVQSPTTRKRDELVSLILQKLETNNLPVQRPTRKGRPVKALNSLGNIISAMTGGEENNSFPTATKRLKTYEEVIFFAQEVPMFSLLDEKQTSEFEGILRLANKIGYFLDIKTMTKVFLPVQMIEKYNLKTGDYIKAQTKKMNSSNQYIVSTVECINFCPAKKYQPVISDKKSVISFDTIPFGDFNLFQGRRNAIQYKSNIYEDDRFVKFAQTLSDQGYVVVVLGLNISFEDSIMLSSLQNVINLSTKYADSPQAGLDKVVDAISFVQRFSELGKKVILFVSDIVELLGTLDLCFEEKERILGHSGEAVVIAQKLISTARSFSDGSQITLVMTYRDYDLADQFLINEVFKVSNRFE